MVEAIPLYFGNFVHYLWLALLYKIHLNTDNYWVDIITSTYGERPAWAMPITLTYWCIFWHRWKLLSLTILKKMRKSGLPKSLLGNLGGQFPKIWFRTSFVPRSDLVKFVASQNRARRGFGKVLQWSAAAVAVVVACVAASGQGASCGVPQGREYGWDL